MPWPKGRPRSAETLAKIAAKVEAARGSFPEAFWRRCQAGEPDACWPWQGVVQPNGYGLFIHDNRRIPAHRASWTLHHRETPPAHLDIDHTCHNADPTCPGGPCLHRRCINPAHLRAVGRAKNVLAGRSIPAYYAARSHCEHGHELTPENSYRARGGRECKRCRADAEARRRAKANNRCAICSTAISPTSKTCIKHRPSRLRLGL